MNRIELKDNWKIGKVLHRKSYYTADPAEVLSEYRPEKEYDVTEFPAEIHDVLIRSGDIENPNIRGINHDTWTDEYDWVYTCRFSVEDPSLPTRLSFEGLDTFCFVYLNGRLIGKYENVFRSYLTEELTGIAADNELVIYFFSPAKTVEEFPQAAEEKDHVSKICSVRAFKSGFQYYCGPDPTLIRVGVYAPVTLLQRESVRIASLKTEAVVSEDLKNGDVEVSLELETDVPGASEVETESVLVKLILSDADGKVKAETETYVENGGGTISLTVPDVDLWWPRTHGTPYCYTLTVQVGGESGDIAVRTLGFRKIDMVGDLDFRINGKPLKPYGGNFEHPDTISNVYRPERVKRILDLAELCHFNILRVWGESEAMPQAFYDECDRRGILIWQDFYLCYSMYSEQEAFMEELRTEAGEMVRKLRHHPCILLWCGGNELILSRDYDHPGEYAYGQKIIFEVFPEVCRINDPGRYYHASSPIGGNWANDPESGDTHGYTHLWFVPGRLFPVFLSENCRVSVPPMHSMRRMMTEEELWPSDYDPRITPKHRLPWPDTWAKHNSNMGEVKLGPVENYFDPTNAEELVYRIGAAHAEYIRRDLERFRRGYSAEGVFKSAEGVSKPAEGVSGERAVKGHILWKFNNNSHIITYGILDYFNEPYYPYYELKRMYAPVLLSIEWGNHAHVFMTNDSTKTVKGTLRVQLLDMESNEYVQTFETAYQVEPDESKVVTTLDPFGQFRRKYVVVVRAFDEQGQEIARDLDWFDMEKKMVFPTNTGIQVRTEGGLLIVTTEKYARCVELKGCDEGDEFGFIFSDNYFDLLPGDEKKIRVMGDHTKGKISAKAFYADDVAACEWRI